jgi:hypothetical protein
VIFSNLPYTKKIIIIKKKFQGFSKPGGLDSRDESRSRLRFLDLSRQTFKTCQDFLDGRDKLFFVLVLIFKIETFQLRLCLVKIFVKIVEIVETNQDCQDLSRRIEICQEISTFSVWKWWKVLMNWEISTRNIQKSTYFSIEIETNCREMTKFPCLDKFLYLNRDF